MVFEAYVSPSDVVEDKDDLPLDGEDMEVSLYCSSWLPAFQWPVDKGFFSTV